MVAEISTATRTEVLEAVRGRYREASKRDKTRMLNEFVAMVGCHRKHAVRLLGQSDEPVERKIPRGRRIYDEAVRQAPDRGVGGFGQDLRQEAEGSTAQHRGVPGETRSSRLGHRCARAAVLGERQYHGPAAQTGERAGR